MRLESLKNSRHIRRRSAFTLIEIMIVVAIIILLAGIAVAVGITVKRKSSENATKVTLETLQNAMTIYQKKGNPEPNDTGFVDALLMDPEVANVLSSLKPQMVNNSRKFMDSWGTPVHYIPSQNGKPFYFQSYGSDGVAGGTDDMFSSGGSGQ